MSYLDWHVGMKVVCVDDAPAPDGFVLPIKRGEVYVISRITAYPFNVGVRLVGVPSVPIRNGFPFGDYRADRFRPIQTRKTDISIFTAMLHGTDQKADA